MEELVYSLFIRNGTPAVVVTDNGRRWAHYFETAERAIEFYEACLGKATDPESRERFLRAVRARWN